jgi:hypothetical protein
MDNFDLKKYLAEGKLSEDRSKKYKFLGIFNPDEDTFQRIIKNIDPLEIEDLIKYTESNGDEVLRVGKSAWGITKESGEDNQAVWQYNEKDLLFQNPYHPSIYDEYIRKI